MNCDELLQEFERSLVKSLTKRPSSRLQNAPPVKEIKESPRKRIDLKDQSKSPTKSVVKTSNDRYSNLLELPMGSWENKVEAVDHVSEPEGGDLVIHVKMYYDLCSN